MLQYSTELRNARLDVVETVAGASPVLKIRTGAAPANPQAADAGTVLATVALPADWMAAAAGGVKSKSGTWQDAAADASGTAGHFRLYKNDGVTCVAQGSVSAAGGGGDMIVDNINFAAGQAFTVTQFDLTAGNA